LTLTVNSQMLICRLHTAFICKLFQMRWKAWSCSVCIYTSSANDLDNYRYQQSQESLMPWWWSVPKLEDTVDKDIMKTIHHSVADLSNTTQVSSRQECWSWTSRDIVCDSCHAV